MPVSYKDQIYALVQGGNTTKAIELGLQIARQVKPAALAEWTLLNNQHDKVKRNERMGTLSYSEASREYNKITLAVLELSGEFDTDNTQGATLPAENKILFLASNPTDTARLQLEKEFARLSHNLQDGNFNFQLLSEWAVTSDKLQGIILRQKPRIIHFSGHGVSPMDQATKPDGSRVFKSRQSEDEISLGALVLEDMTGKSREVNSKALEELFAIFAEFFQLEVVVLNACYSALQAEAINQHVPYVVGMREAIQDQDAIDFTSSFYMTLALENNVPLAFRLACNQIRLNGRGSGGDIPVLHSRV